jgi:type II secretory pathway pseudopilin PulG
MKSQLYLLRMLSIPRHKNLGFSYVEAVVALVIALVVLAAVGPLFWNQRERNVNSQVRTGAAAVAQRILEDYRREFRSALPALTPTPLTSTRNLMGNTYRANVIIREFGGRNADGTFNCTTTVNANSRARCIRVEVRSVPEAVVYDVETVYTQIN